MTTKIYTSKNVDGDLVTLMHDNFGSIFSYFQDKYGFIDVMLTVDDHNYNANFSAPAKLNTMIRNFMDGNINTLANLIFNINE